MTPASVMRGAPRRMAVRKVEDVLLVVYSSLANAVRNALQLARVAKNSCGEPTARWVE